MRQSAINSWLMIGPGMTTGLAAKSSVAVKGRGQVIYRAVDTTEETIIRSTGKFSLEGQDIGLKYFANSLEDAHQYGQWLYKDGYKVVEATVKGPVDINRFWYPNVDIGAYAFPQEILLYIIPK